MKENKAGKPDSGLQENRTDQENPFENKEFSGFTPREDCLVCPNCQSKRTVLVDEQSMKCLDCETLYELDPDVDLLELVVTLYTSAAEHFSQENPDLELIITRVETAIDIYEQVRKIYHDLPELLKMLVLFNFTLANAYSCSQRDEDREKAIRSFKRCLDLISRLRKKGSTTFDELYEGIIRQRLSAKLEQTGNFRESVIQDKKAVDNLENYLKHPELWKSGQDQQEAQYHLLQGLWYLLSEFFDSGKDKQAEKYLKKFLTSLEKSLEIFPDQKQAIEGGLCTAYTLLCEIALRSRDYKEQKKADPWQKQAMHWLEIAGVDGIASFYSWLDLEEDEKLEEGKKQFFEMMQKEQSLNQKFEDKEERESSGGFSSQQGMEENDKLFDELENSIQALIKFAPETELVKLAQDLIEQMDARIEQGDVRQADFSKTVLVFDLSRGLDERGNHSMALELKKKACEFGKACLADHEGKINSEQANFLTFLFFETATSIKEKSGNTPQMRSYLDQAYRLLEEMKHKHLSIDTELHASILMAMGQTALQQGRKKEARRYQIQLLTEINPKDLKDIVDQLD